MMVARSDGNWVDPFGHVWESDEPDGSDNCLNCNINHMSTLAVAPCADPSSTMKAYRLKDGNWNDSFGHVWKREHPELSDRCLRCDKDLVTGFRTGQCPGPAWELQVHGDTTSAELTWQLIEAELRATFERDMVDLKQKALEYGGSDLLIMGKSMESLIPHGELDGEARSRAGIEMAIGFYLQGKVSRLFGAWNKGREPSEDTWHDAEIYCKMARYVRRFGAWT